MTTEHFTQALDRAAVEPVSMIWSFPHQINLTFGRRAKRLHQHPACGGRGSGG